MLYFIENYTVFFDKTLMYTSLFIYNCQSSFSYAKKLHKKREHMFWKTRNEVALKVTPPKCLYYRQKMIQRYFTTINVCLFSLGGGNLKVLIIEARSKIIKCFWQKFERLFEDEKLLMHTKYINKVLKTKIAHLVVKRSSFISVNS
jgi:hypothetical protein